MWDLTIAKETAKLKGHLTSTTCLTGESGSGSPGYMVVTGSEDTNLKVWDLRMKTNQCVLTFKEH